MTSFTAGKSLAIKYCCKYIESSPGINHNVDELLVGMLAQIQLRGESKKSIDQGQIELQLNVFAEKITATLLTDLRQLI